MDFYRTVGDKVSCSVLSHGSAVIVEGFEKVKINKKPTAYEGCKVSWLQFIAQHALNKVLAIAKTRTKQKLTKRKEKAASKKRQEQVAEVKKTRTLCMVDEDAESDSSER